MPLTSEQIVDILSSLGSDASLTTGEKRRRAIRVKHRDAVTIIPCHEPNARTSQQATMTDFSSRGVALQFWARLPAREHFILVLPSESGKALQLLCEVAHCRERPDGTFAIGAEFVGVAPTATSRTAAECELEASRISTSILS